VLKRGPGRGELSGGGLRKCHKGSGDDGCGEYRGLQQVVFIESMHIPSSRRNWATNLEDRPWGIKAPFKIIRHMTEARFAKWYPESPERSF
jgi:hypothetical protein